jgi:hypothetical protein
LTLATLDIEIVKKAGVIEKVLKIKVIDIQQLTPCPKNVNSVIKPSAPKSLKV